jgi:sigma-B regulation protein RsbU (phosphoserine phosphatase)
LKDNISYVVKDAPQADDMTFLLLEYQGDEMNIKSIEVESSKNNLNKVLDFAHKFLEDNKIYTLGVQIDLILEELYSNVNKYAYDGDEGIFHLRMNYNKTKKELSLTLVDKGKEFNPLKTNPKKVEDKNAQEGGLGILIVKNFADSFSYNRINEKNILLIKKKI